MPQFFIFLYNVPIFAATHLASINKDDARPIILKQISLPMALGLNELCGVSLCFDEHLSVQLDGHRWRRNVLYPPYLRVQQCLCVCLRIRCRQLLVQSFDAIKCLLDFGFDLVVMGSSYLVHCSRHILNFVFEWLEIVFAFLLLRLVVVVLNLLFNSLILQFLALGISFFRENYWEAGIFIWSLP